MLMQMQGQSDLAATGLVDERDRCSDRRPLLHHPWLPTARGPMLLDKRRRSEPASRSYLQLPTAISYAMRGRRKRERAPPPSAATAIKLPTRPDWTNPQQGRKNSVASAQEGATASANVTTVVWR